MGNKIVIMDYGMGNLRSVQKKLTALGASVVVSNSPKDIAHADKLILPGVGHFAKAVSNLKRLDLWDALHEEVMVKKKPILGICLGMQLFAKRSEEGNVEGLAWVDASVLRFKIQNQLVYKVPHMGWNQLNINKQSILLNNMLPEAIFYFVHSYYMECANTKDILTTSDYESTFTSAIEKDNIFGVQFHPEKSHEYGAQLLTNFLKF